MMRLKVRQQAQGLRDQQQIDPINTALAVVADLFYGLLG